MNIQDFELDRGFNLPWKKSKPVDPSRSAMSAPNRIPYIHRLPHGSRGHFVAMVGEFIGTFLFLFLSFAGTQVANTTESNELRTASSDVNRLLYISLSFGFSLAVNAWVFFRISGGLFNPAVNLGMCLVGALTWLRGGLLLIAQMLGAMASAAVVSVLFPGQLAVTTTLGAGTSVVQGLFIEMFLTAQLVFTIFMLAAEKHKATHLAPVGIGLSLFVGELAGVLFTGGALNPARSFAPCVVLRGFPGYHWIYWLGPILGAAIAAGFYKFIKMLEYETANPGQDDTVDLNNPTARDAYGGQGGKGLDGAASEMPFHEGNAINADNVSSIDRDTRDQPLRKTHAPNRDYLEKSIVDNGEFGRHQNDQIESTHGKDPIERPRRSTSNASNPLRSAARDYDRRSGQGSRRSRAFDDSPYLEAGRER